MSIEIIALRLTIDYRDGLFLRLQEGSRLISYGCTGLRRDPFLLLLGLKIWLPAHLTHPLTRYGCHMLTFVYGSHRSDK